MKFKIGDKVTVISDLSEDEYYHMLDSSTYDIADEAMLRFTGKTVTIALSAQTSDEYGIEEDDGEWCWTDEMFIEGQPATEQV